MTRVDQLAARTKKGGKMKNAKGKKRCRGKKGNKKTSRRRQVLRRSRSSSSAALGDVDTLMKKDDPPQGDDEMDEKPQAKPPRAPRKKPAAATPKPKAKAKATPKPKAKPRQNPRPASGEIQMSPKPSAKAPAPKKRGRKAIKGGRLTLLGDRVPTTLREWMRLDVRYLMTEYAAEMYDEREMDLPSFKLLVRDNMPPLEKTRVNIYWTRNSCGLTVKETGKDVTSFYFPGNEVPRTLRTLVAVKAATLLDPVAELCGF